MPKLYLLLLFLCPMFSHAQTTVHGSVKSEKDKPIAGANVSIKDSYDGATTDAEGHFSFTASDTGHAVLIAAFVGYETVNREVHLNGKDLSLEIVLKETVNMMKVVTISAGAFEASDAKRTTVLKPLDIVTTAGAGGDTYSALKTLPGTSANSGDQDGLFVRGGTGAEAPTFIDGLYVRNPYFSSVPDIASRGRFSPFLFKGTIFSTGGYSAQYGEGMSSALILETQDMPDKSESTVGISSVGLSVGHVHLLKKHHFSYGGDLNYVNLLPYYSLIRQVAEYTKMPEIMNASFFFRKETSKTGMLKFYSTFSYTNLGLRRPDVDDSTLKSEFDLKNTNLFLNLTYKEILHDKWKLNAGGTFSFDVTPLKLAVLTGNNTYLYEQDLKNINHFGEAKVMLTRSLGKLSSLRFGEESEWFLDVRHVDSLQQKMIDGLHAAFVEGDLYFSRKLVARLGGRYEYSTYLRNYNLAPRVSLAYKLGDKSQVAFAYGDFYEKPESSLLWTGGDYARFEKATHYILNLQTVSDTRTFRVEGYYKVYANLTRTLTPEYDYNPVYLDQTGVGYAKGIDVFWRDKKSIKGLDYWISYSYLDTKRIYRDYVAEVQPTFAAKHTATLVMKKFVSKINTSFGATFTYASGRPYYNPNKTSPDDFLTDYTPDYQNIGLNAAYLTHIGKAYAVLVLSANNILGSTQIYGYHYSADGSTKTAVTSPARRTYFLGLFMSFGRDRRQDAVNNNN